MGGAGRAKGFGGPVAPAESKGLPAEGEGGGRTTPLAACAACEDVTEVSFEESAVASSASEASLGICTLSRGRLTSEPKVLDRATGGNGGTDEDDAERVGINGACVWPSCAIEALSMD